MFAFLSNFFEKKKIDCFAPIPLSVCKLQKPYLLEREKILNGTVILFAIPYYTSGCRSDARNLSAYAVGRDYHLYFKELFDELLPQLHTRFPKHRFAGFADHSPINEVDAAARAGLGLIGKNGLLITQKYSSYVFLGEIVTDSILDCSVQEPMLCAGCGLCKAACPKEKIGSCLSALTQKRGNFTNAEAEALLTYQTVWGCDLCQEVCPYTKQAICNQTIETPIDFFKVDCIPMLDTQTLLQMSDADFSKRAYAWRGRAPIERNLKAIEMNAERKK